MTQPFDNTFVLFADMLGFADLVECEGSELTELNPIYTGVELYSPSPAESLLGYRFINFHRCLNQARERLKQMGAGSAIIFSDSAFFRLETLENAIHLARTLMFELVTSDIPVRMGLACGSYRMLRFLTDSSANVYFHMSQFLGTGVVRAYQAERCGLPGLRIFLHPTLESLVDNHTLRIVPVQCNNNMRTEVQFEINYLDEEEEALGPDFQDCIPFDSLQRMMSETDEAFHYHYMETFSAWDKMRAQYGRDPYPWEKFLSRDEYDYARGIRQRPSP